MSSSLQTQRGLRGFSLIEVTLVISVLLGLTSVLFLGATAYKKGADRAHCIQNIAAIQKALRSHCNLIGVSPGAHVPNLKDALIGADKFVPMEPVCPSGGIYSFGDDFVPVAGIAWLTCSLPKHEPKETAAW